jgi:hypothetical protein
MKYYEEKPDSKYFRKINLRIKINCMKNILKSSISLKELSAYEKWEQNTLSKFNDYIKRN